MKKILVAAICLLSMGCGSGSVLMYQTYVKTSNGKYVKYGVPVEFKPVASDTIKIMFHAKKQ